MSRQIFEIAREIRKDWVSQFKKRDKKGNVIVTTSWIESHPYLDAMLNIGSIDSMYGDDSAKSVVAYFLSNAQGWRGEVARRIKAELNELINSKTSK